jgi:hypothetical protein
MQFTPQNRLESSLVKAESDPAHRPQFYKDLIKEDLFIVQEGPIPDKSGKIILEEDTSIQIKNIEWEGRPYVPVFSSLQRLQTAIQEEVGYMALNALEFMKITKGAELLLNPGSDYGKAFTKEEISALIDGSMWQASEQFVAKKDTQVMIGQPSNYPKDLAAALTRYFKKTKQVKKAYLAHFFNPEHDEKAHTMIALEVSGDWDSVMAGAGMVARDSEVPDPPVDFLRITGKGGIEDYFTRDCEPFYTRTFLGLF